MDQLSVADQLPVANMANEPEANEPVALSLQYFLYFSARRLPRASVFVDTATKCKPFKCALAHLVTSCSAEDLGSFATGLCFPAFLLFTTMTSETYYGAVDGMCVLRASPRGAASNPRYESSGSPSCMFSFRCMYYDQVESKA